MISLVLSVLALNMINSPIKDYDKNPVDFSPEYALNEGEGESTESESTSESESTEDLTSEESQELDNFDQIIDSITSSEWWGGVFAALVSFLTANTATIIGLSIGLIKTRAKKAIQDSKYKADVELIANKFNLELKELEKRLDQKIDDLTDKVVAELKKAGKEKEAAEFLAGKDAAEQVDEIIIGK